MFSFLGGYLSVLYETEGVEDVKAEDSLYTASLLNALNEFGDAGDFSKLKQTLNENNGLLKKYALSKPLDIIAESSNMSDAMISLIKNRMYGTVLWIGERFPERLIVNTYTDVIDANNQIEHWVWLAENIRQRHPLICFYHLLETNNFSFIEFLLNDTDLVYRLKAPFSLTFETSYISKENNVEIFYDNDMLNFFEHYCPNEVYDLFLSKVIAYVYHDEVFLGSENDDYE
jgi:hypothetical protein